MRFQFIFISNKRDLSQKVEQNNWIFDSKLTNSFAKFRLKIEIQVTQKHNEDEGKEETFDIYLCDACDESCTNKK